MVIQSTGAINYKQSTGVINPAKTEAKPSFSTEVIPTYDLFPSSQQRGAISFSFLLGGATLPVIFC